MFFGVSRSVTECFQSVTDYLQSVTELGTPKNMAVALPGMTLQPLYSCSRVKGVQLARFKIGWPALKRVSGLKSGLDIYIPIHFMSAGVTTCPPGLRARPDP